MSLILSGTNGLSDVDGSAATPAIRGTDTNTGIFFPAADTIAFAEGGVEAMRLDSSGNLGLGVTPSAWDTFKAFDINTNGALFASGGTTQISSNAYYATSNYRYKASGKATAYVQSSDTASHAWYVTNTSGTATNIITFTQAMTLDASGNLGVGTTSPNIYSTSNVTNMIGVQATGTNQNGLIAVAASGSGAGGVEFGNATIRRAGIYALDGSNLGFYTNSTNSGASLSERARIDSSGNLLVGTTSTGPAIAAGFAMVPNGTTNNYLAIGHPSGTSSGNGYCVFAYNSSIIGSITQNGTTGVLYNLTSDYRLKNNQQPLTGAKEFVMALQPKKWQWWDGSGEGVGFIAHEFMEVAKYSGHGEKDAVDEEGNIIPQSIQPSSSEVMANLVALIQEQQAIIIQLQADVAALKGTP